MAYQSSFTGNQIDAGIQKTTKMSANGDDVTFSGKITLGSPPVNDMDAVNKGYLSNVSGITDEIKQALLQCFQKVAWVDDQGQTYYDALYDALYPPVGLDSITCVYTQSGTVYDTDSLDDLKSDLVVTAHYEDSTSETVTTYTLSGTLTEGTSTITVSYGGESTTFNVVVTHQVVPSGYTAYDYITLSTPIGTAYGYDYGIMTDIAMSSDYTLETSVYYTETNVSATMNIMGVRDGSYGTKQFAVYVNPPDGKLNYWYGGTDTSVTNYPYVVNQLNTIKVQPVGVSQTYPTHATININGTDYDTGSSTTGQTWKPWLAFFQYGISATGMNGNITNNINFGLRIGEVVIKDSSNNVIHDLIPAYNGTYYGFYDSIGETFYCNSAKPNYVGGNWE